MRRDSNALFSHIGQQGRVLSLCFPCFPFLAAFFRAVLEGGTGGVEEEAAVGGWGKPNNPNAAWEGEDSSIMKGREGVMWATRLGTVWSVLNGKLS